MALNTIDEIAPRDQEGHHLDHYVLECIEAVCITWFTIEYILRLIGAPNKCRFLKGFMNFIDLLAIAPYYIEQILVNTTGTSDLRDIRKILQVFQRNY